MPVQFLDIQMFPSTIVSARFGILKVIKSQINIKNEHFTCKKGLYSGLCLCFSREAAARSILRRHIRLQEDGVSVEKEELLRGKLLVPSEWIHDAKV